MENADLLTNAAAALDHFRSEVHRLETEVDVAQAKLEVAREALAFLEGKATRRRGRPPKLVVERVMPLVVGEIPTTEVEPPELETVA